MLTNSERNYYKYSSCWYFMETANAYFLPWLIVFMGSGVMYETADAFSVFYLSIVVGIIIVGFVSHIISARKFAIFGFFLLSAAVMSIIFYRSSAFPVLNIYAYSLLFGFGTGFIKPTMDSILPEINSGRIKNMTINTTTLNYFFGLTGTLMSYVLISGNTNIYLSIALLLCAMGIFFLFSIPAKLSVNRAKYEYKKTALNAIGEITSNKIMLLMSITYFMIGVCSMAIFMVGVALHVKELDNGSDFYIAGMQIAWSLGGLITGLFLLRKIKSNNHSMLYLYGWLICSLGVISFGLSHNPYFCLVAGVVWGAGTSIGFSMTRLVIQTNTHDKYKGAIFSAFILISFLGAAVGAKLLTVISGFCSAGIAVASNGMVFAVVTFCLFLMLRMAEKHSQQRTF
ncbi:MFS transporter [Cronobacter sakazakii]|uniref:MFS transporter n=3 Tax=Cronobacter sakazakii TaxID=28141 RepID=UPI000A1048CC|nr:MULTISPECIES: MFS transporter [Cronobacter]EIZ2183962.1 MFS transporter [Cronobacter sakazakii]EIZ2214085.1 MFS transporter [Cronobacter sakazakii]EIZ2218492.1 MFS transporter [Cronobacter sakazakii]EIZ2222904.1 MFS transporter [Cronobacter sakazakii]EIZ2227116.1 MFS transporter [Cronobacter sakazakii]